MSEQLDDIAHSWDEEYRQGRYTGAPPVPFVNKIRDTLSRYPYPDVGGRTGLYVGCGNGRNYLPLVDTGLDLVGLDISEVAIAQLRELRPTLTDSLVCASFQDYSASPFAYLIAIQVF